MLLLANAKVLKSAGDRMTPMEHATQGRCRDAVALSRTTVNEAARVVAGVPRVEHVAMDAQREAVDEPGSGTDGAAATKHFAPGHRALAEEPEEARRDGQSWLRIVGVLCICVAVFLQLWKQHFIWPLAAYSE
jgi:hypothetical protein